MSQLGKLNLKLALARGSALSEYIEDQSFTVEYPAFDLALKVSFLNWRNRVVEQNQGCIMRCHHLRQFLRLTAADKCSSMRSFAVYQHLIANLGSG